MTLQSWEELVPNLTYRFVPDIWFESPGEWADVGPMGLHMWFAEPWEYVTVFATSVKASTINRMTNDELVRYLGL